jgi:CheY-like chemotaxis protein
MSVLLRTHRATSVGDGVVGPRSPPAETATAPRPMREVSRDGSAPTGFLRVLVADDNRDAADSWSILIKLWGHGARVAYDGLAALAIASDELPDVLLLDIAMPKMDGHQLARHLRRQERFANTLLIAVTGWADKAHRQLWESAFDHYLIKPVPPPALETLLWDRARLVRSRSGDDNADDGVEPRRESLRGISAAGLARPSAIQPDHCLEENLTGCG